MTLHVMPLGGKRLPFFYEKLRPSDSLSISRQMQGRKFDPALILGTANRCRFGCPRVIVCSPLRALAPFPTSFWLTCPWLVRRAGAIEAAGGVGELERWIERRAPVEWISFNLDHQRLRLALLPGAALNFLRRRVPRVFRRLRSGGVGGIQYDKKNRRVHVKCIHLQIASWLALRRHPGEPWLEAQNAGQDCRGSMENLCGHPRVCRARNREPGLEDHTLPESRCRNLKEYWL
ncbi:MAG: DUF501 domain-containing protein [Synergistaceae bacterium]|nr:DUF501 domain-containing protein [Synergistaceae bacterium]